MENKTFLEKTKNNVKIYIGSETLSHMEAHKNVEMAHVKKAIKKMEYNAPFSINPIDLGEVIGTDSCVTVGGCEEIKMMVRKNRDGATPIVFGRKAEPTSQIVIGICRDDDGLDTLFTAFYGQLAPKEPWDPRLKDEEREESKKFWSTHALVYDESMF